MKVLHFLSEYIKHPRTVGAAFASSKQLAKQMVSPINFEKAKCIIEYGPGTGVFTEQLIQHKHNDTVLLI
ncbi:rRNA adenine N-6-methyltransferase family protein, partial [Bacillus sp. JJ864]|uniref:rRNA adenine N-6-methyltransferase family protein n=1 Tax=Bacillus sp. JJ864 TaxID=3122975 RepID=UPI002FFE3CC3